MWHEQPPDPAVKRITNATDASPGERMLYALGKAHRRWRAGSKGAVPPHRVDAQAVARAIGVWDEVEFIQSAAIEAEHGEGRYYIHFPAEVIVFDPRCDFPWMLLSVFEWAERQQIREFWRYFH